MELWILVSFISMLVFVFSGGVRYGADKGYKIGWQEGYALGRKQMCDEWEKWKEVEHPTPFRRPAHRVFDVPDTTFKGRTQW